MFIKRRRQVPNENNGDFGGQAKAAAALCNICSETDANRELVVRSGGLPSLIDMLLHP